MSAAALGSSGVHGIGMVRDAPCVVGGHDANDARVVGACSRARSLLDGV